MAEDPLRIMCLPYVQGLSEKLERVCTPLGVRVVSSQRGPSGRPWCESRSAFRRIRRGVVYEVPCKEWHQTYIGETKRTLKVRLREHKQVVKRGDPKNGIAAHTHESNHTIDWDGARVKRSGMTGYWQRRTTEAIHIKLSEKTMNLDGSLQLPTIWNPVLNAPWPTLGLSRVCFSRPLPPHPMIIIITSYQYSLFLIIIIIITHDLSLVMSLHQTLPPLLWRFAVYIRPSPLFFSILTDEDLHSRTILHFNLYQLLRDCSTIAPPLPMP